MPVHVPKIGCVEDIWDLRVQHAGFPAENLSSRFEADTRALGYAKRLAIASRQIDIFGEAQSRSVPAFYLDCWTIGGQIRNITIQLRTHDPPEDYERTKISPAFAIH
jgi:hypothetical protein